MRGSPSETRHSRRTLSLPPVMSVREPSPWPEATEGTQDEHITPPSPAALTSDLRAQNGSGAEQGVRGVPLFVFGGGGGGGHGQGKEQGVQRQETW